jgi:hypothetical protein
VFVEIKGYKFIAGKIVPRPWGTEYRFSVISESTGKNYDDTVMVNPKATEKEIGLIVESNLAVLSAVIPEPVIEKRYSQTEVDSILKEKKYLDNGKHFPSDLPVKTLGAVNGK